MTADGVVVVEVIRRAFCQNVPTLRDIELVFRGGGVMGEAGAVGVRKHESTFLFSECVHPLSSHPEPALSKQFKDLKIREMRSQLFDGGRRGAPDDRVA